MYKILIVEDDPNISSLLQSHIQKYGYEAVVAENFDDIMESFNAVKPHLVLLDVNLPKFDGFYWCVKFVMNLLVQLFSFQRVLVRWNKLWRLKAVRMITLQSVPLRRCNGENQGQLRVFTVIMHQIFLNVSLK